MQKRFNRLSITTQLVWIVCSVVLLISTTTAIFVDKYSNAVFFKETQDQLKSQVTIVKNMLNIIYNSLEEKATYSRKVLEKHFEGEFILDSNSLVDIEGTATPKLTLNGEILNKNIHKLEELKFITNTDFSLFVKSNNDFIRIASTIKAKDNKAVIGKIFNNDYKAYQALMQGQSGVERVRLGGHQLLTYYMPIKDKSNQVVGALFTAIDLEPTLSKIKDFTKNFIIGDTGYIYILDIKPHNDHYGEFVIHPSLQTKLIKDIKNPILVDLVNHMLNNRNGVYTYAWEDKKSQSIKDKVVAFAESEKWSWVVASGSFREEFGKESTKLRNILILVSILSGIVTIVTLYFFIDSRLKLLRNISDKMYTVSTTGDLRVQLVSSSELGFDDTSRNEVHRLALRIVDMLSAFKVVLRNMNQTSDALTNSTSQLKKTFEHITNCTSNQANASDSVSNAIEQMSFTISGVADNTTTAQLVSQKADDLSNEGERIVHEATVEMSKIVSAVDQSAQLVMNLGERSKEISNITHLISEITEQTNMLALNAAIEAARAGEAGRGFAVVADEVRKLAERTAGATERINAMILTIQKETKLAAESMDVINQQVQRGAQLTQQVGQSLLEIHDGAAQTVDIVTKINQAMIEQSQSSQNITHKVEHISDMTRETSSVIGQVGDAADKLSGLSKELHILVSQFKV